MMSLRWVCFVAGEELWAVVKDWVRDYLRKLHVCKCTGPTELQPVVLREWGKVLARPLSIVFERSWGIKEVSDLTADRPVWEAMGLSALADHWEDGARLFTAVHVGRMRGYGSKLRWDRFSLDIRSIFAHEGSQAVEVVQRGCTGSVEHWMLSRCAWKKPWAAWSDLTGLLLWAGGLTRDLHQSLLSWITLWLYSNVFHFIAFLS